MAIAIEIEIDKKVNFLEWAKNASRQIEIGKEPRNLGFHYMTKAFGKAVIQSVP